MVRVAEAGVGRWPRNGVYMELKTISFSMVEGNHRAARLLVLADKKQIPLDTPIYVHNLELWKPGR